MTPDPAAVFEPNEAKVEALRAALADLGETPDFDVGLAKVVALKAALDGLDATAHALNRGVMAHMATLHFAGLGPAVLAHVGAVEKAQAAAADLIRHMTTLRN